MESFFAAHRQSAPPPVTEAAATFHPFFSVLSSPADYAEQKATASTLPPPSTTPQIELVQSEGRVTKIVVTCKCCERIELECEY